jgi:hypothetical protein
MRRAAELTRDIGWIRYMEYRIIMQDLAGRIDLLPRQCRAFVLAALAQALFPLVAETRFARAPGGSVIREAVATASQVAVGIAVDGGDALVGPLGRAIPHSEDLTEMEEYYALDALIFIDATLRSAVRGEGVGGMIVDYALLPLHQYLCDREYGYLDIGSSPEEIAWESRLSEDPIMAEGIRFVESIVAKAESAEPVTMDEMIAISARERALLPPATENVLSRAW